MSQNKPVWIKRSIANEIFETIETNAAGSNVIVYLIEGMAGTGKTFLAKDIGERLGSPRGYEPASESNILWSGILDLYDPDTNSNQGLEQRIIRAFSGKGTSFNEYQRERDFYDLWFKTGIRGSGLEDQRKNIEQAFSRDLAKVTRQNYPVIVLDTIERLENAADPIQKDLDIFTDTASVIGWLTYQITNLPRGLVILLGRRTEEFRQALEKAITESNQAKSVAQKIDFRFRKLSSFDDNEINLFFQARVDQYPKLAAVMNHDVQSNLGKTTKRNPLLLDMAIQTLLETSNPRALLTLLQETPHDDQLNVRLLEAYNTACGKSDRPIVLQYLAIARNGLFEDLLKELEPNHADRLIQELHKMEDLPFIKFRDVYVGQVGESERKPRRTYFLHDEMYLIYDRWKFRPFMIQDFNQKILNYYDQVIHRAEDIEKKPEAAQAIGPRSKMVVLNLALQDHMVESVYYRMRANPVDGFQWFIRQEDRIIRNASIGLDMRLRDSLGQFMNSALTENLKPGETLSSPIDHEIVNTYYPTLHDENRLESGILWIKRSSFRGDHKKAIEVATAIYGNLQSAYEKDPELFAIAYAEQCLWFGQALMYKGDTEAGIHQYNIVIEVLKPYQDEIIAEAQSRSGHQLKEDEEDIVSFRVWRYCLALGRTYNNLGFTHWMNQGKYRLAIREFQQAVQWFRFAGLREELANTNDNMGRVYSLLGFHTRANDLIRRSLIIRNEEGLSYRAALSQNSLAISLNNSGQPAQALPYVDEALLTFRNSQVNRGIGLGLITHGTILRNQAELWREQNEPSANAIRQTENAEADLREAATIFDQHVSEPIRLVQAYNELGCCLRARFFILQQTPQSNPRFTNTVYNTGCASLRRAAELAEEYGFIVEQLDSIQDLAVIFFRAGQIDEAEDCLKTISEKIPENYKIKKGIGLNPPPIEESVDAFFKLLGQLEMLKGAIAYHKGQTSSPFAGSLPKEVFLETILHYLFAVVYFNAFSGEPYSLQQTYARMYSRFQGCPIDVVKEITHDYIPNLLKEYNLPENTARGLFADVFGIFE